MFLNYVCLRSLNTPLHWQVHLHHTATVLPETYMLLHIKSRNKLLTCKLDPLKATNQAHVHM